MPKVIFDYILKNTPGDKVYYLHRLECYLLF